MRHLHQDGAVREALWLEMARDERQVLLCTASGRARAGEAWYAGLEREFGAARVLTLPTGADALVGVAIGLSAGGMRPIVELGSPADGERARDQLVQLGRARQRSQGRLSAKVTIRAPVDGTVSEALYARCPGLRVVAPSSPGEAKGLFLGALRDPDPVVFLEPFDADAAWLEDVPDGSDSIPVGKAKLCHGDASNADVLALAYGGAVRLAIRAAEVLAREGIRVAVLDVRALQPLDEGTICAAAGAVGRCVVVVPGTLGCSVAPELVALVEGAALVALRAPVVATGAADVPGTAAPLRPLDTPRVQAVVDALRAVLAAAPP